MASANYGQPGLQEGAGKIPLVPEYSIVFSFEQNFDVQATSKWFREHAHLPYLICIVLYLGTVFTLQALMRSREPFKLRGPLFVWNISLALFSIFGFARVFPEFYHAYTNFGFLHTVCNDACWTVSKTSGYWIYLFVLSKIPELMDTIFLVLKKQNLIFLHVWHHASVGVFSWFIVAYTVAGARWFCTMNFGVHSIMYTYYALKAIPNVIRIPKWVSMLITTSQTIQMVIGTYVVVTSFVAHMSGQPCATTTTMAYMGFVIYFSYLILFSHFFYKSYLSSAPLKQRDDKKRA